MPATLRSWSCGADAIEVDEEMSGASQTGIRAVGRRIGDESRVLQPAGQLGERDLRLRPGQRSTEAVMDAAAEAQMLVVLAVGVEAVGIWDAGRVAAAGGEHECDPGALGVGGAGAPDVVEGVRGVARELHRWFEARGFLDHPGR